MPPARRARRRAVAACFAALGWLPAMILLVFFSLANLHTGLMIHRVAMLHPKRGYTYGGLIAAVLEDDYPRLGATHSM